MEIDLINEDANDIPLPKVETTFFDKFFLVLIMLLSGGVIWVTMQYSKDMICTSLALLIVAYVGGLALFNCLCFKFKYEIYLAKDILNWKDDMKAQLLYTIMSAGIICGLFWVSWTFINPFHLPAIHIYMPKMDKLWVQIIYWIVQTILLYKISYLEALFYNVTTDICSDQNWLMRILATLIYGSVWWVYWRFMLPESIYTNVVIAIFYLIVHFLSYLVYEKAKYLKTVGWRFGMHSMTWLLILPLYYHWWDLNLTT